MWEAIFAGAPDLVSGAKGTCSSRKKSKWLLGRSYAENRRWYLEDVLGDLASISLHQRDEDRESGVGSELVAEQQDLQQDLLDMQADLIAQQQANVKIEQSLALSELQNEKDLKKQQQTMLYVSLAVLLLVFVMLKAGK